MNRFVYRRDLHVLETTKEINEVAATTEISTPTEVTTPVIGHGVGNCQKRKCGQEAACIQLPDNTYMCVCPHDSSPPTADLRCPNRLTVPITPKPIHNIIPPGGSNDTSANSTTPLHSSDLRSLVPEENIYDIRILAGASGLAVVILITFSIIFWWKRKGIARIFGINSDKNTPYSPSPLKKSLLLSDRYTINTQYSPCLTFTVPLLQSDTLTFQHEIGEGCFGKVFKGELRQEGSDHAEIVAIKVLKDAASRKAEEDFMREVDIMSAFRHENILSLIGVVLKDNGLSPMMVFEYMAHGDLAELLRQNARSPRSPHTSTRTDTPTPAVLTGEGLLSVALQIASGMRYLAAQRFVHRDLACRNCLVGNGLVVKIADFGMSRDVYTCDYYKIGGSRLLPVRWMSPESVMYGKFTLESDIWAYGVVLWEIYSYGKQPYYGHTNEEVLQLILHGTMLNLPENIPPLIAEIIHSCWKVEARDRIPFVDIFGHLQHEYACLGATKTALSSVSSDDVTKDRPVRTVQLPRPPPEPIAQLADLLDADGYLLPQENNRVNYLQTLSD